jgi:7-keto-8-aminopelargonate synthetase-like enzyme
MTGLTMIDARLWHSKPEADGEAAVAEFIRTKGVTRCPTACVSPTQGSVAAADREALEEHAAEQDRLRKTRVAARTQQFWSTEILQPALR